MKKQLRPKPKKSMRRSNVESLLVQQRINNLTILDLYMGCMTARRQMMPPHIRTEFERLERLPDGKPTFEQSNRINELLRTYIPSQEAFRRCLDERRLASMAVQSELGMQLETKPKRQGNRFTAQQLKDIARSSMETVRGSIAYMGAMREMMPPDDRAEYDRLYALSIGIIMLEPNAWLEAISVKYEPSDEAVRRHLVHVGLMLKFEESTGAEQSETVPASKV